jgi:hypothetical protein
VLLEVPNSSQNQVIEIIIDVIACSEEAQRQKIMDISRAERACVNRIQGS